MEVVGVTVVATGNVEVGSTTGGVIGTAGGVGGFSLMTGVIGGEGGRGADSLMTGSCTGGSTSFSTSVFRWAPTLEVLFFFLT